jgi:hypothetical protein
MFRRSIAATIGVAVLLVASTQVTLAVNPSYGGWQTTNWKGIDGYLRQSTTVSTQAFHAVWISICGHNDCTVWTQTGTYQGVFAGGSSPNAVHIYYENVDGCGTYYRDDLGAPAAADSLYHISRNSAGAYTFVCPGGNHQSAYTYEYRIGSFSNTPYFYGSLPTNDGLALAKTETQGSPPINTDFFGCTPTFNCDNAAYGMHLWNGSTWSSWTGASTASRSNPPYLHTFHNYWSYKTCPTSC